MSACRRPDRLARPDQHLPLRPRLRHRARRSRSTTCTCSTPSPASRRRPSMIVHEDGAVRLRHGQPADARAAEASASRCRRSSSTPTRRATSTTSRCASERCNPDLVIPSNYYNEFVLLLRTMQQQQVRPKAIYSRARRRGVELPLRARNFRRRPTASWTATTGSTRKDKRSAELRSAGRGAEPLLAATRSLNYSAVTPAGRRDRARRSRRPRRADHGAGSRRAPSATTSCPMARRSFVNGQNQGAQPLKTQVSERRHQGDLAARIRRGAAGLPVAG